MPLQSILEALAAGDGYGKIMLSAGADGAIAHAATMLYIKPLSGETIPAFLRRLQGQIRPGDAIELGLDKGTIQLARITRSAAAALPATQ